MKTSILLLLTCAISFSTVEAQNSSKYTSKLPSAIAKQVLLYDPIKAGAELIPLQSTNRIVAAPANLYRSALTNIGNTTYDLQTNSSIQNRIINISGNQTAIWTTSASGTLGAPDRGTGYNHFNGSAWLPASSTRIESTRTGWPSIMSGTTNEEIIINHNFGTNPLVILNRPVAGTGSWTTGSIAGLASGEFVAWPRATIGGSNANTIHLMGITLPTASGGTVYNGMDGSIVYSRSLNGGSTWDIQHITPPGMTNINYGNIGGDSYAIDSRGDVVAMVSGGFTSDLAIWKSVDNGANWIRTVALPFPIPAFPTTGLTTDIDGDGIADTLDTNDSAVALLIDNNDMVHIWAGAMRVLKTDPAATGINYFPGTDGLLYWNESMGVNPPVNIAEAQDIDGNGMIDIVGIANYQLGITTMPNAGIDASGNIYCVYSSIVENTNNGLTPPQSYRNVYAIASNNGGASWGTPYNVSDSDFDEGVFASIARNVDNDIHVIWQSDTEPGLAVRGDMDPFTLNDIMYANVPVSLLVGIKNIENNATLFNLYPNPAKDKAMLSFEIDEPVKVEIKLVNLMGQTVSVLSKSMVNPGQQVIEFDIQNLNPGLYFMNANIGKESYSKKLVIN